jgi:hypothetical protein
MKSRTVFVENVRQSPPRQSPLAIPSMASAIWANARRSPALNQQRGTSRGGARYNDVVRNGDDRYPQQTPAEKAADIRDVRSGSWQSINGIIGDVVESGGSWPEEGGPNGIARSQGNSSGLSTPDWNRLLKNVVLGRRQRLNVIDCAISPTNDPGIFQG